MLALMVLGALLLVIVLLIITALVLDASLNTGTNAYPSALHLAVLFVKLFLAPLLKGSTWKKLVRQDSPELDEETLTRVIPFTPKPSHLRAFHTVCSLSEKEGEMPALYPAVILIYPNVCIFGASSYPFPAIGTVHVCNTTTVYSKLSAEDSYRCVLKPNRKIAHVKKGSEVEFLSTLMRVSSGSNNNDKKKEKEVIIWSNSSSFLVMHNQRKKAAVEASSSSAWTAPEAAELTLLHETQWTLSANASVEYAHVSKDFNPIHMSSLLAKLFGFPGIIMHGMYLITRAASECQNVLQKETKKEIVYPFQISTKFQRPCVLPQKPTFSVFQMKSAPGNLYFTVKGKGEKILLDGYLKTTKI